MWTDAGSPRRDYFGRGVEISFGTRSAIRQISRQSCIDACNIGHHAVEEVGAGTTQQPVQNGLVDFSRAVSRGQRRNVLGGTGFDLRANTGGVQAERRLKDGVRQIDVPRDHQRTPQLAHRLLRRQMRPLVEPLRHQELGARAGRAALAFNLDLDPNESLRRRVDDDGAEPERPGKADLPFEKSDVLYDQAWRHRKARFNPARFG